MSTSTYAMTGTSPSPSEAYLTPAEYRQSPTGVDPSGLVKGDAAASEAELVNIIGRACSFADFICGQVIAATPDTEADRLPVNRDGNIIIHPRQGPLLEVTGIAYGGTPTAMTVLTDLSGLWVDESQIVVGAARGAWSGGGPLQFSAPYGTRRMYVRWSYVAGWPNTSLAAAATGGTTSLTVKNAVGIFPTITTLVIYDGAQTETVKLAASYVPGSTVLTLAAPLQYSHTTLGVSVSAFPPAVKQAVILLTSALIRTRGSSAIVMASISARPGPRTKGGSAGFENDLATAQQILCMSPCRRVR